MFCKSSKRSRHYNACGNIVKQFVPNLLKFFPRQLQVIKHRPNGQHGGDKHQQVAGLVEVDAVKVGKVEQQRKNGGHLRGGFEFADIGDGDAVALAHLRHPFAQGGDGDFAPDDNHGVDGERAVEFDQ